MVRRTGPGGQARILVIAVEGHAVDPRSSSFSSRSSADAVEEQVDRQDDDDEVVEATEDRQAVGHEVAPEDDVAGRAPSRTLRSFGIRHRRRGAAIRPA